MDKRWRNLGVLVLIVIILVAGYWYISQPHLVNPVTPATTAQLSDENRSLLALANLFSIDDINVLAFRTHEVVTMDSDGNLSMLYTKEKLLSFKTDLLSLKSGLIDKVGDLNSAKASLAIDAYSSEIDFDLNYSAYYQNYLAFEQKAANASFADQNAFCDFVGTDEIPQSNQLSALNDLLIDLGNKDAAYQQAYGVVLIDLNFDNAFGSINYLGNTFANDFGTCGYLGGA